MRCEIFFFYNKKNVCKKIAEYIEKFDDSFQIITNSNALSQVLREKKKSFTLIDDIFPNKPNKEMDKLYDFAKKLREKYSKFFKDISFRGYNIFSEFDYLLGVKFVNLAKANEFLKTKKNIIFIFEDYSPIYYVILKLASELGFKHDSKIKYFQVNKIDYLSLSNDNNIGKQNKKLSFQKLINFIQPDLENKFNVASLKTMIIFAFRLSSLLVKMTFFKLFRVSNKGTSEFLRRLDKKIKKLDLNYESKCVFFITGTREDLFIKPLYPIFDNFKKNNTKYLIVCSDLATSIALSREKLSFVNVFEEVKILSEQIYQDQESQDILKKVIDKIDTNSDLIGITELKEYFITEIQRAISIITICEYIIKKLNLNSIFVFDDGEILSNFAISVARKHKIPSYSMLNVLLGGFTPWLVDWFHADKIFVYGKHGYESLRELSYPEDKLIVVGNTKFDYMKTLDENSSKKKLQNYFNVDIQKKIIAVGMSKWSKNDEIWMSKLIKFCNQHNFEIIIKIHPRYRVAEHEISEKKINEIGKLCRNLKYSITYDFDIATLLSASDLVVTDGSNVGIEAILLKKPLIRVSFEKDIYYNDDFLRKSIEDTKASIHVEEYPKLEKAIFDIMQGKTHLGELDKGRDKIIEKYNLHNDGKAGNRIFNILTNS